MFLSSHASATDDHHFRLAGILRRQPLQAKENSDLHNAEQLALARGTLTNDVILISSFEGPH
jgi:hypothetical protein